jgi:hypothetical protein
VAASRWWLFGKRGYARLGLLLFRWPPRNFVAAPRWWLFGHRDYTRLRLLLFRLPPRSRAARRRRWLTRRGRRRLFFAQPGGARLPRALLALTRQRRGERLLGPAPLHGLASPRQPLLLSERNEILLARRAGPPLHLDGEGALGGAPVHQLPALLRRARGGVAFPSCCRRLHGRNVFAILVVASSAAVSA